MSTEVDTEKNPLLPGVENPGYDGTGEEMEMVDFNKETSTSSGSVETTYARNFIRWRTNWRRK